jgi:hypothetical protein
MQVMQIKATPGSTCDETSAAAKRALRFQKSPFVAWDLLNFEPWLALLTSLTFLSGNGGLKFRKELKRLLETIDSVARGRASSLATFSICVRKIRVIRGYEPGGL